MRACTRDTHLLKPVWGELLIFHRNTQFATHTTIVRSRDHGRSWDTEPKGFAVAPRANIEALTMASWPGG